MKPLLCGLLCLSASPALAGGYYFGDSGIVAGSRGGAWVAGADNQFAQLYNPAGLVRIKGPTLNLGASAVYQGVQFERLDQAGRPMDLVTNQAGPFPVPQMGFAMPFADKFAFAIGGVSALAPDITFTEDGAQRYTLIDSSIWQYSFAASLAWQPVEQFSIGAGVTWQIFRAAQRLKVSTSLIPNADGSDRPEDDVLIGIDTWDEFTPGFNMGIMVEPIPALSIGASVYLPSKYQSRGSATMDFTGHALEALLDEPVVSDDDVVLNIQLPLVFRWGIAVRPWEHTEIELGGDFETWSQLEDILVEDIDADIGIGEVPEEIALPAGFRDTFSIRLGGETRVNPMASIRAGVMWERTSLTPQLVSPGLMDTDKVFVGTGTGLYFMDEQFTVDVGLGWMFYQKLDIKDSTVSNINVLNEDLSYVVGNGKLSSHGWIISTQLSYRFGSPSK